MQLLLVAFAFKSLASGITIYSVSVRTAIEVAPAASILSDAFGIIPASIIVNVVWLGSTVGAFYLIQKMLHNSRAKRTILRFSLLFVLVPVAFDGLWDLGVLLRFTQFYLISILILTAVFLSSYFLARPRALENLHKLREKCSLIERS